MSKRITHGAFGYFLICGRRSAKHYLYPTTRSLVRLITCKACIRKINDGYLPLFPNGMPK